MKDIILETKNLSTHFPVKGIIGNSSKVVKAVEDVSLTLYRGETYGLVGETGCGKSTFGRTVIGLNKATSGSVSIDGTDITKLSEKELLPLRKKMQMVFQDPYTSLDGRMRIGDTLNETLAIQKIGSKKDRMNTVLEIMGDVGLIPEHYYRFPHELSGGQRQRVGLARALLTKPELIVCDEPVSALDVSVRSQIINLLTRLQREHNLTYLFISHDMSVVKYVSDRVGVMYLGHLVEEGTTEEIFSSPRHPYTKVLLSSVPLPDPRGKKERIILTGELPSPVNPPSGCVFHTRCPYATDKCKNAVPATEKITDTHFVACHKHGETEE